MSTHAKSVSTYSTGRRRTIIAIVVSRALPFLGPCIRVLGLVVLIVLYRGRGRLMRSFCVAVPSPGRLPPFGDVVPRASVLVSAGARSKITGAPFEGRTRLRLTGDWCSGASGESGGWRAFMARRNQIIRRWGVVEELRNGSRRDGGRNGMIIENPAE
jgi:hypothetical protein